MNTAVPFVVIFLLKLLTDIAVAFHERDLIPLSWLFWNNFSLEDGQRYEAMAAVWATVTTLFSFALATWAVLAPQRPYRSLPMIARALVSLAVLLVSTWTSSYFLVVQFGPL